MRSSKIRDVVRNQFPEAYNTISSLRWSVRNHSACKKKYGSFQNDIVEKLYPSGIIDGEYETIIDVGAAEGYYAVGLACKCPKSQVIAFDTDPIARSRQKELAKLNSVSNIDIQTYCTPISIAKRKKGKTVLVVDIEGFELGLLPEAARPILADISILVETHRPDENPELSTATELKKRFEETHDISEFHSQKRSPTDWTNHPAIEGKLTDEELNKALSEDRAYVQSWLWMCPKDSKQS